MTNPNTLRAISIPVYSKDRSFSDSIGMYSRVRQAGRRGLLLVGSPAGESFINLMLPHRGPLPTLPSWYICLIWSIHSNCLINRYDRPWAHRQQVKIKIKALTWSSSTAISWRHSTNVLITMVTTSWIIGQKNGLQLRFAGGKCT